MEAEAFWELFKEYEDAGGDGYIHTVVQPAMNLLKVIDIEDAVSVLRPTNTFASAPCPWGGPRRI